MDKRLRISLYGFALLVGIAGASVVYAEPGPQTSATTPAPSGTAGAAPFQLPPATTPPTANAQPLPLSALPSAPSSSAPAPVTPPAPSNTAAPFGTPAASQTPQGSAVVSPPLTPGDAKPPTIPTPPSGIPAASPVAPGTSPLPVGQPLPPASQQTGTKPAGSEDDDTQNIPSIMFKPEIITRLDETINNIMTSTTTSTVAPKVEDDFLNQLLQQQPKPAENSAPVIKYFPTFYLNTLIYTSRDEWSAWINGVKLTNRNNKTDRNFSIASISKREVTIRWKPIGIWPDLVTTGKKNKESKNPKISNQPIEVDEGTGFITFTLHPNQTFISEAMLIKEGHYVTRRASDQKE